MPDVIVVAANARGEIVRYFEAGETASYFGSPAARNPASGQYDAAREGRMIASTGKILAAIGIANAHSDRPDTLYLDRAAPARGGLESCDKGGGDGQRPARDRRFCLLAQPPDRVARGAAGPGAHAPADRPLRLQSAAAHVGRGGDAALDGGGARADRRLAAARASDGGAWCWPR